MGGLLFARVSNMYTLKYIELVQYLATRACGGTVVFQGGSRVNIMGVCFLPHVSKVYSLEDTELVPNMATRACGGTVVYPIVYQGFLGVIIHVIDMG